VTQVDSTSLLEMRQSAAFDVLLPRWLPPKTDLVSYRWWADGATVELHTVTHEKRDDNVTGRLTIQQWTGARERESSVSAETPGFGVRNVNNEIWLYAPGEPDTWVGAVGDVQVRISTTFEPKSIEQVIKGMG
jgi:hypothetical protein